MAVLSIKFMKVYKRFRSIALKIKGALFEDDIK